MIGTTDSESMIGAKAGAALGSMGGKYFGCERRANYVFFC